MNFFNGGGNVVNEGRGFVQRTLDRLKDGARSTAKGVSDVVDIPVETLEAVRCKIDSGEACEEISKGTGFLLGKQAGLINVPVNALGRIGDNIKSTSRRFEENNMKWLPRLRKVTSDAPHPLRNIGGSRPLKKY